MYMATLRHAEISIPILSSYPIAEIASAADVLQISDASFWRQCGSEQYYQSADLVPNKSVPVYSYDFSHSPPSGASVLQRVCSPGILPRISLVVGIGINSNAPNATRLKIDETTTTPPPNGSISRLNPNGANA